MPPRSPASRRGRAHRRVDRWRCCASASDARYERGWSERQGAIRPRRRRRGSVGALTVLPGYWQLERAAVGACLFGIGIYGVVVLTLHFQSSGSLLTQLGVLIVALLFYIVRLLLIRGHDFEPRR